MDQRRTPERFQDQVIDDTNQRTKESLQKNVLGLSHRNLLFYIMLSRVVVSFANLPSLTDTKPPTPNNYLAPLGSLKSPNIPAEQATLAAIASL
jgi:hypothetical protein